MSEEVEALNEQDIEEFSLSDIEFDGKTLKQWQEDLTIILPPLPCSSHVITQKIIDLNNNYQIAYNCLSKLLVLTNRAERAFKQKRDIVVSNKLEEYAARNVTKTPTIEKLEVLALNSSEELQQLNELCQVYTIIKDFFLNNKNKLERIMELVRSVSYGVNQSESRYSSGKENQGL